MHPRYCHYNFRLDVYEGLRVSASFCLQYHLNPTYTPEEAATMATVPRYGKALDGTDFIPGSIGLNNLKETDYFNVVIQVPATREVPNDLCVPFSSPLLSVLLLQ